MIRDKNYTWTKEGNDALNQARETLTPLFDSLKDKFSHEEIYYAVNCALHEMILKDALDHRYGKVKPK